MDTFYLINLRSRPERLAKMANRFNYHKLPFKVIEALTPQDPEVQRLGEGSDFNALRLDEKLNCKIGGEFACFASHLKALKEFIDSNEQSAIIIEDDALLRNDTRQYLDYNIPIWRMTNIPLVMLYTEAICNQQNSVGVHNINSNWCTTGYWISRKYAIEAYEKYNVKFNTLPHFKTSECITMFSGGKFVLPQLFLEDPINLSNIRDTRANVYLEKYHLLFDSYLDWSNYSGSEPEGYQKLLRWYICSLKNQDSLEYINISTKTLDLEQQFFYLRLAVKKGLKGYDTDLKEFLVKHGDKFGWTFDDVTTSGSSHDDPSKNDDPGVAVHERYLLRNDLSMKKGLEYSEDEVIPNPFADFMPEIADRIEQSDVKAIINAHITFEKNFGYSNYIARKPEAYKLLIQWYFDCYLHKKKYLLKLNPDQIKTLLNYEKMMYYDLVLGNSFTEDLHFGIDSCQEFLALLQDYPNLSAKWGSSRYYYFSTNMNWYYKHFLTKIPKTETMYIRAHSGLDYNPWSLRTGIFGSEEAVIYLGSVLSNKYIVTIENFKCGQSIWSLPFNNPRYLQSVPDDQHFDIGILWRRYADLSGKCTKVFSWHHDTYWDQNGFNTESNKTLTAQFMLSNWHLGNYSNYCQMNNPVISGNGIIPQHFQAPRTNKNPHALVYTSCYDRGLVHLLNIWPELKTKFPNATLDICYGWQYLWNTTDEGKIQLKKLFDSVKHLNITDHGTVGHAKLISIMKNSSIWAYPCKFYETFCITGVKMQACGVVPVVNKIGALADTVGEAGYFMYNYNVDDPLITDQFKTLLFSAMSNVEADWPESRRELLAKQTQDRWSWDNVADLWIKNF